MLLEKDGRHVKYATLLSGGMDSLFMLYDIHPTPQVAISVDYNQRHQKELHVAAEICQQLDIKHVIITIDGLRGSSLLECGGMLTGDDTVVPGRNALLIYAAANIAVTEDCCRIAIGCNQTDVETYPDCRPEFLQAIGKSLALTTGIRLTWPLGTMTKQEIYQTGLKRGYPMQDSWSCYFGGLVPCGHCGACVEVGRAQHEVPD